MGEQYNHIFTKCDNLISIINEFIENEIKTLERKSDVLANRFKKLEKILGLCREKIKIMSKNAHLYDFDDKTRANGYRTHIKLFEKIVDDIILCLDNFKNSNSIFKDRFSHLKRIKCWFNFLIAFYPTFCVAAKLIKLNSNSLLIDKDHKMSRIVLGNSASFVHEAFYGELFGFQYNVKIRKILNFIVSIMASYSIGYDQSSIKIFQAMIAAGQNSYFFMRPKKRCPILKQIYSYPTVEFCKAFMSLNETAVFQYVPAMIGPTLHVNRSLKIKVHELSLTSRHDGKEIILFGDSSSSKKYIGSHVRAQLYSLRYYEGQTTAFKTVFVPLFKTHPNSPHLIIYIHGGGFVSLSSKSCEIFIRNLASSMLCPVLSIDYSLSPQAVFPQALEECFYAYCWCIDNSIKIGSSAEKIILIGDSAGGNLILGVTQRAIAEGIRVPDGLLCAYPCCSVEASISPSRLLCNIDTFLSSGFLFATRDAYLSHKRQLPTISESIPRLRHPRSCSVLAPDSQHNASFLQLKDIIEMDPLSLDLYSSEETACDNCFDDEELSVSSQNDLYTVDRSEDPLASPLRAPPEILCQFP